MGTYNFKPRQRAYINKKLKKVKELKTTCTWNGITDYLKITYNILRVMITLIDVGLNWSVRPL
jgi:hypothetical protein